MALTDGQKQLVALLAQRNPDADYMIKLSSEPDFAISELASNIPQILFDLTKEKEGHQSHLANINARLAKIEILLSAIEELST